MQKFGNTEVTSKKFEDDVMSKNCNVTVVFLNYGHFEAIREPNSERMVCNTFSLTVTFSLTKTEKQN